MDWKLAEAKQRLSEVVRRAAEEPQRIFNRDRPVAAVIAAESLDDYLEWRGRRGKGTLRDSLHELTEICREEGWEYGAPPRRVDRANALVQPRRASRRHKRRQ